MRERQRGMGERESEKPSTVSHTFHPAVEESEISPVDKHDRFTPSKKVGTSRGTVSLHWRKSISHVVRGRLRVSLPQRHCRKRRERLKTFKFFPVKMKKPAPDHGPGLATSCHIARQRHPGFRDVMGA